MTIILDGTTGITTPNLTNTGTISTPANLAFTGTGNRITGDFSNSTTANRVIFQTTGLDAGTTLTAIPNGASGTAQLQVQNSSSSLVNYSYGLFRIDFAGVSIRSDIGGTGTYLPMSFYTGGTERARIDSSGNLLVGTTTQRDSAKITCETNSNGLSVYVIPNLNAVDFALFRVNGGSLCGAISRVGTTSAVIYNTTSDYRLKEVIGAVSGAGDRIDALQPIEYTWKADGAHTRGFLAHKFQEVYPGSVNGEKDAVDEDGKPKYQAMQASTPEVIADLVAELQSLRKRIAILENK